MQDKDKLHAGARSYGYKRRGKRPLFSFEWKGKPDPVKYYFFAMLFLALGVGFYFFDLQRKEELRLTNPATANVKLIEARCLGPSGKVRLHMFKTYVYTSKPSGGIYKAYDSVEYASPSECASDLPNASSIFPHTFVWYDPGAPWDARWSLDEPSSTPILWAALAFAGFFIFLGLLDFRKVRRNRNHDSRG